MSITWPDLSHDLWPVTWLLTSRMTFDQLHDLWSVAWPLTSHMTFVQSHDLWSVTWPLTSHTAHVTISTKRKLYRTNLSFLWILNMVIRTNIMWWMLLSRIVLALCILLVSVWFIVNLLLIQWCWLWLIGAINSTWTYFATLPDNSDWTTVTGQQWH